MRTEPGCQTASITKGYVSTFSKAVEEGWVAVPNFVSLIQLLCLSSFQTSSPDEHVLGEPFQGHPKFRLL